MSSRVLNEQTVIKQETNSTSDSPVDTEYKNESVLCARNLFKTFHDGKNSVEVIKNVSIEIQQSDMTAIIGASGSGKSTLLHVLGGLDTPDEGEVLINGINIHQQSVKTQGELRNKYLGFIYQFHHLLSEFTALENVAIPLLIGKVGKDEAYTRAEEMIAKTGLAKRLSHKPSELSGGERQRIAIARAMVTKPACILADEPTGNLDTITAKSINELMFELNETEKTSFLIVSHDLALAESMQKTYKMDDGRLELIN